MRLITGIVEGGKVEIPPGALMEGAQVAILAPEGDDPVQLGPREEQELEAAVEEIRRGRFVDDRCLWTRGEKVPSGRGPEGLATLLGRWEDGDEFADEVDRVVAGRGGPRSLPDIES